MNLPPSKERTMDDLVLGESAEFHKTITESDIALFAGLSGDFNRIHVDAVYAAGTEYGQRIAHGFLTASLLQPCMTALTTPGGVSLNYNISMKAPVFVGDTITARAEIVHKRADKPIVTLKLQCTRQDGAVCIEGEALIYMVSERREG